MRLSVLSVSFTVTTHDTRHKTFPCSIVVIITSVDAVRGIDLHLYPVITVHDDILYLLRQLTIRRVERELILLGQSHCETSSPALRITEIPSACRDRALIYRELRIRDTKIGIDSYQRAYTGTLGTCTVSIIEREASGRDLAVRDTAVRTRQILRKEFFTDLISLLSVLTLTREHLCFDREKSVSKLQRSLT